MAFADDLQFARQLLDTYAIDAWRMSVTAEDRSDRGVPPEMQVGEVNADGWVEWKMIPSTLEERDVAKVEAEFGVKLPMIFRAYLLARFHLFDQVGSQRYNQQIMMTHTPARRPLEPLREIMSAWRPLIDTGFVPFAEWGDSWGPMCFDSMQREADAECPVVWMDHELLIPLLWGNRGQRENILPLVHPLYGSCREFLMDVFTPWPKTAK